MATYTSAIAVTKSDVTVLAPTAALYIGVSGDVAVNMTQGNGIVTVVFKAVPVGILPIQVTQVLSTGTTATNVLALR